MAKVRDLSGNAPIPNTQGGIDPNSSHADRITRSYPVVANDAADLPQGITEGLCVTTSGVYKVTYANGLTDTPYLTGGIWHPINVKRVWSTGSVSTSGISAGY